MRISNVFTFFKETLAFSQYGKKQENRKILDEDIAVFEKDAFINDLVLCINGIKFIESFYFCRQLKREERKEMAKEQLAKTEKVRPNKQEKAQMSKDYLHTSDPFKITR